MKEVKAFVARMRTAFPWRFFPPVTPFRFRPRTYRLGSKSLQGAVRRNWAEGILLSGGLDISILAATAAKLTPLRAYTASLQGVPVPDVEYASLMAERLRLKYLIHTFDRDELFEAIPVVVRTMRSFDPMEVRNSVTVYIALTLRLQVISNGEPQG